jgi:hypothetical protein
MNKLTARIVTKGVLAVSFAAAIGMHACHARNPPRVALGAEAGARNSKVVASVEDFSASPVGIEQQKDFSPTLAPAVLFLRTYYQLGRDAERDELIKLYAPEMRTALGGQFRDNKAVAKAFADLGRVEVDSALSWGFYRVVLVNHHSKANPQQVFPWVHTIACQDRCTFVEQQELGQVASYLFYLGQYGKQSAPAGTQGNGALKLALYPIVSDKATLPGLLADPVELYLKDADAAAKSAGAVLLSQLIKYPQAGAALDAAAKAVFDGGTPKTYPRKAGDGKTTDQLAWEAYIKLVRSKTWTPLYTFQLRADTAILIARSGQDDLLFLPFHQVGRDWRLFTTPGEAPFWPLFEGRPFAEAIGKLIRKP